MGKLGDTLRERRQTLGVTLEQAQDGTRIRGRLIKALEDGEYDRLPNPGYVRGYISSYARFLELDPVPLLNMYKAETGATRFHDLNLPQTSEAVVPLGEQHAVPWRIAVTAVLIVVLLSLAIWAVTRVLNGPAPTPPVPAPVTQSETTKTATTPTTKTATETVANTPAAPAKKQPFTLTVTVANTQASWLRITVDKKIAYEGTLAAGQSKEFQVSKQAVVSIGKPEAVTILRDGKPVTVKSSAGITKVTLVASETAN